MHYLRGEHPILLMRRLYSNCQKARTYLGQFENNTFPVNKDFRHSKSLDILCEKILAIYADSTLNDDDKGSRVLEALIDAIADCRVNAQKSDPVLANLVDFINHYYVKEFIVEHNRQKKRQLSAGDDPQSRYQYLKVAEYRSTYLSWESLEKSGKALEIGLTEDKFNEFSTKQLRDSTKTVVYYRDELTAMLDRATQKTSLETRMGVGFNEGVSLNEIGLLSMSPDFKVPLLQADKYSMDRIISLDHFEQRLYTFYSDESTGPSELVENRVAELESFKIEKAHQYICHYLADVVLGVYDKEIYSQRRTLENGGRFSRNEPSLRGFISNRIDDLHDAFEVTPEKLEAIIARFGKLSWFQIPHFVMDGDNEVQVNRFDMRRYILLEIYRGLRIQTVDDRIMNDQEFNINTADENFRENYSQDEIGGLKYFILEQLGYQIDPEHEEFKVHPELAKIPAFSLFLANIESFLVRMEIPWYYLKPTIEAIDTQKSATHARDPLGDASLDKDSLAVAHDGSGPTRYRHDQDELEVGPNLQDQLKRKLGEVRILKPTNDSSHSEPESIQADRNLRTSHARRRLFTDDPVSETKISSSMAGQRRSALSPASGAVKVLPDLPPGGKPILTQTSLQAPVGVQSFFPKGSTSTSNEGDGFKPGPRIPRRSAKKRGGLFEGFDLEEPAPSTAAGTSSQADSPASAQLARGHVEPATGGEGSSLISNGTVIATTELVESPVEGTEPSDQRNTLSN